MSENRDEIVWVEVPSALLSNASKITLRLVFDGKVCTATVIESDNGRFVACAEIIVKPPVKPEPQNQLSD